MWWIIGIIVVWFILYKLFGSDKARIKSSLREYNMIWVNGVWYVIGEENGQYVLGSSKHGTIMKAPMYREDFIDAASERIISLSRQ